MTTSKNILDLLKRREIDDKISRKVQTRLHVTEDLLIRLGLEKELDGHTGCVNCLEWNSSGELLASASDDFRVIVWDPFRYKALHTISTSHSGNIFSVKFMPKTNDTLVVTGAADCMVNVHDIQLKETIFFCSCHANRVKRLATSPDSPSLFWSSSEDGTIRQFDLRVGHSCRQDSANVLISLKHCFGPVAEAKCLAINPLRSELLAVGANDPYVRLYDRRMLRPTSMPKSEQRMGENPSDLTDNLPDGCAEYFVPGHLRNMSLRKYRSLVSTYVTFGANGRDLLVNLGGEQIYLFDIYSKHKPMHFDFKCSPYYYIHDEAGPSSQEEYSAVETMDSDKIKGICTPSRWILTMREDANMDPFKPIPPLQPRVEALRLSANYAFESEKYSEAIRLYNEAIALSPNSAVLYGNRSAALMKRKWDGDMYDALRDCQRTLDLEPNHYKAHFRMIRCLHELFWTTAAAECLKIFKNKYPSHVQNTACRALEKDIESRMLSQAQQTDETPRTWKEPEAIFMKYCEAKISTTLCPQEMSWQEHALDFDKRFCGHCNTTTDIKEANFFGEDGQFIVAGSDDGTMFFWNRNNTNVIRVLKGDGSIVNCLQPHPSYCLLASSGIDTVVRLWSPFPQDGRINERDVDMDAASKENQIRMKADPFITALRDMVYSPDRGATEPENEDEEQWPPPCSCRPS